MKFSIGDICKSTLYFSVQPNRSGGRGVHFGAAYVGTIFGVVVLTKKHSAFFHIRNPFFDYSKV